MGHLKGPGMGKDDNNIRVFQLSDLLNEDNIKDARLVPFVKVWKPGTTKSYLGSLCSLTF